MIRLSDVGFDYISGTSAVRALSAEFVRPQLVALVGPNGSGKSTLMKMMARVLSPSSGNIAFEGRPVADWSPKDYAQQVGYLPQDPDPVFPMKAIDVVLTGRAPFLPRYQWESQADIAAADDALARCDAMNLRERYLEEMSGGERKRVFLARVLAGRPRLVLLDEPLAALDIEHIESFTRLLREIVDETGSTVIFISHDLNWSAAYADRMMVMNGGSLVLDAAPEEVMNPEVMRRYFSFNGRAVPSGSGQRTWIVPDPGRS
ncbi:MAG: ABC transporter ATP-binding protein [Acidobacteriota bacterium]